MDASSIESTASSITETAARSSSGAGMTLFQLFLVIVVAVIFVIFLEKHRKSSADFSIQSLFQNFFNKLKDLVQDSSDDTSDDTPDAPYDYDEEPRQPIQPEAYGRYLLNVFDYKKHRTIIELNDGSLNPGDYISIAYRNLKMTKQDPHCKQEITLSRYNCGALAKNLTTPIYLFRDITDKKFYLRFSSSNVIRQDIGSNHKPDLRPYDTTKDIEVSSITEYCHEPVFYVNGLPLALSINHKYAENNGNPIIIDFSDKRGESIILDEPLPSAAPKRENNSAVGMQARH